MRQDFWELATVCVLQVILTNTPGPPEVSPEKSEE